MTSRELSALISAGLVLAGTVWYIVVAIGGTKVKPVLASWIVLAGTMTLSYATYWTSPKHNLVSNACNAASVLSTLSILATVIGLNLGNRRKVKFSSFQKWCLLISGLIAAYWIILVFGLYGTGTIPNILTQILMLIGYLVTAERLWNAEKNTESLMTWGMIALGSSVAVYTSIVSRDWLALLYAGRAAIAATTIVGLMYRLEKKKS